MGLFTNPLSHAGYPPGVTGTPTTQPSEVRAATLTEANAGVLDNVYISPSTLGGSVSVDFASPPVLGFGSTTPRPVHATTLDSSGNTSLGTGASSVVNVGIASSTIGFFGATAVAKPASTDDLRTALINLGLYTTGGASPLNLNGGAFTAGALTTVGTANINTTGTAVTNIGNTTGNTLITGSLTASTGLVSTTGGVTVNGGDIINSHAGVGTDVTIEVTNTDNTNGASRAGVEIATGGSSGGDPYLSFQISGVGASTMTLGLDNSASDLFVISNSAAIGTSNALTLSQAGALTATTTLTATLGDITATNGNFVGTASGTGILLTSAQNSGAASGPVVVNGRSGRATFTTVSIAGGADLTLTITNSSITGSTTEVMLSMSGATTGAALSIKSKTASASSLAIVVTNGTGATTTTADIQIDFLILNA